MVQCQSLHIMKNTKWFYWKWYSLVIKANIAVKRYLCQILQDQNSQGDILQCILVFIWKVLLYYIAIPDCGGITYEWTANFERFTLRRQRRFRRSPSREISWRNPHYGRIVKGISLFWRLIFGSKVTEKLEPDNDIPIALKFVRKLISSNWGCIFSTSWNRSALIPILSAFSTSQTSCKDSKSQSKFRKHIDKVYIFGHNYH